MSIIEFLIEQRKQKKITQKTMSKHLGCTHAALNRYEKEKRKISFELIQLYAEYLGFELKLMAK